ncbi:MAG TPA: methyltransferase domain-containing protein [bacterium]|nr:methyltransferase domain-containing protein [bacterium]
MQTTPWLFDELAHAGDEHVDATYIAGYERKADYDPSDDVARLRELGLGRTDTLVDLGAGTGALAVAVAPFCRRVVAVDISAPMLAVAEARAKQRGITNLGCVRSGFLTYVHQGEPADFVCSRHALHHLPDFWKAVALVRVAAMLRPGGLFRVRDLVYSFAPSETERVLEQWLARASQRPDIGWTRAELETHVREEYSTFTWLLEPMLERAGLEIRESEYSESQIYAAYTCVRVP